MTNPIFVRPRHQYDSYVDYWRLVELAGYPVVFEDEVDAGNADATYILTMLNLGAMAEQGGGWPGAKAHLIYWDLEWHDLSYAGRIPGIREFWTSDRHYASLRDYRFVPLGSHPNLVTTQATARYNGGALWDVAWLAYMGPHRRAEVYQAVTATGLNSAPTSAWGADRDVQLERARCLVHVHQHDEFPCLAAQRFALAAAATIPVISETMRDPFPLKPGVDYLEAAREDIPSAVSVMLHNGLWRDMTAHMWQTLCADYRFDKNVTRALQGEVFA